MIGAINAAGESDMNRPHDLIALVTLLALVFFLWTTAQVAFGRVKYGVPAPAITGQPAFERLFRIQMNTLEGLALFLPSLWLFAIYWNDFLAAGLGAVWLVGRVIYAWGYAAAAEKRGPGYGVQGLAMLALLFGAIAGALRMIMTIGFI
jgi:uncharacterized membrane protein YecN with MAPEG domain